MNHKVLVATDQNEISEQLNDQLTAKGHEVLTVTNLLGLLNFSDNIDFSLILIDLALFSGSEDNGQNGKCYPQTFIILRDCCGNINISRDHIRGNIEAFFFRKDEVRDIGKKIHELLKNIVPMVLRNRTTIQRLDLINSSTHEIVTNSKKMREVVDFIKRVSEKRIDVLIMGETGTGKELVARAIHKASRGGKLDLVSLNCAAIPGTLIESEIFGHEEGAFTGALRKRIGKFELADGGTLFLDEIGDMSLEMQAKLLRALETKEFTRLGGEKTVRSDVCIISATNKDLFKEVDEGRFRSDLYYRLNVASITLPPLRERKEDIPLLVDNFIKWYGKEICSKVKFISPEAMSILLRYDWPGNIRELKNSIKRAIVYCDHDAILPEHLPAYLGKQHEKRKSFAESVEELIYQYNIQELSLDLLKTIEMKLTPAILKKTGGNQKKTADILGIAFNTLKKRMSKNQLR